ncbi:class I SAM-dependent methyltransferase [Lacipirellula sp.]|uniref:class I SAM-dependent methyltransferase n=1 Tax=Lacipirellula sp. TaxID=2691419 RepID=UPI003D12BE0E
MRFAMVTLWHGEQYNELAAIVNPAKQAYCDRYGYDFKVFDHLLDSSRPASWSKILAVKEILAEYDWVIWTDVDAILWDPSIALRQLLQHEDKDLVIQRNHDNVNAGVFFVRNCTWSRRFLDAIYAREDLTHHHWWEQQAIIESLDDPLWADRCHVYPHLTPQPGFHGYHAFRSWNNLLLHFAGIPMGERATLIEHSVRLAAYPPHLRIFSRLELPTLFNRLGLVNEGVEVGVGRGEFARQLLDTWEGRKLHLVDAWRHLSHYRDICNLSDEDHEMAYRACLGELHPHMGRFRVWRELSIEAASRFHDESLDFVHLDANPSYQSSVSDLSLWWPKVRPGGILCGHDFLDGELPEGDFGVARAVSEFEARADVKVAVTPDAHWPTWYIIKPEREQGAAWIPQPSRSVDGSAIVGEIEKSYPVSSNVRSRLIAFSVICRTSGLLPHFLEHYLAQEVDEIHLLIVGDSVLQTIVEDYIARTGLAPRQTIHAHVASQAYSPYAHQLIDLEESCLASFINGDDWILNADLDEFVCFGDKTARQIVDLCKKGGFRRVEGLVVDRFGPGFSTPPIPPWPEKLQHVFPLRAPVTKVIAEGWDNKVILRKPSVRVLNGHHYAMEERDDAYPQMFTMEHFKWSDGVLEHLEVKARHLAEEQHPIGIGIKGETERLMTFLQDARSMEFHELLGKHRLPLYREYGPDESAILQFK